VLASQGCQQGENASPEETGSAAEVRRDGPLVRGDSNMTGVTPETLGPPLDLAWEHEVEGPVPATAVVADGRVFVGTLAGPVLALDLASGEVLWSFDKELGVEGAACLAEDLVCFGDADGKVHGLDRETGESRWVYETEDSIAGGLNSYRSESGQTFLLVGSDDFFLHAIDAADGSRVWAVETQNYIRGAPSVDQESGVVIFGGCDEVLRLIDAETGDLVRQVDVGAYMANSCAVRDRIAYLAHYAGEVLAVDLENGDSIWTHDADGTEFVASPAVTADRVYVAGRDQKLRCLDRSTGDLLWEFTARKGIDSSPVVTENAVFFGSDDGRVYAVNPVDGSELWAYEIGARINASPAVAQGRLVIGSQRGGIFGFEEGEEAPAE